MVDEITSVQRHELEVVVATVGEDRAWSVGPLSAGQFLSLFLLAIGAAFIVWGLRTRQYERAQTATPAS